MILRGMFYNRQKASFNIYFAKIKSKLATSLSKEGRDLILFKSFSTHLSKGLKVNLPLIG